MPVTTEKLDKNVEECLPVLEDSGSVDPHLWHQDNAVLRELCWKMGERFPSTFLQEGFSLLAVYPHLGFLQWHVSETTALKVREEYGKGFDHEPRFVLRVYDVTGIEFDGFNAVRQYDINVSSLCGCYYLNIDRFESCLMAEAGYVFADGSFKPCVRSNVMYFDRPRKSSCFRTTGLYVSQAFTRVFAVENVTCSSVFDEMNSILEKAGDPLLSAAIFLNESAVSDANYKERPVTRFLFSVIEKCRAMGAKPHIFTPDESLISSVASLPLVKRVELLSKDIAAHFETSHTPASFGCVQCHDWYSAPVAMDISKKNNLPLIAVIHSLEAERSGGQPNAISKKIERQEFNLIKEAHSVLVSSESIREIVIRDYGKSSDSVFIVPDTLTAAPDEGRSSDYVRCRYGLSDKDPVVLFSGEISWDSGADLLVDAAAQVSREYPQAQYVFAGDGPMRHDLEHKAWCCAIADRCRFPGDVPVEIFEQLLSACDFVVIPARAPAHGGLSAAALRAGKPVVATHQARLHDIRHDVNGLLIYDNHGSVVWGVRQMLSNPLRILRSSVSDGSTLLRTTECIAAMYISRWASAALN
ncbi:MAG: glycosyltransferase [Chitinispirillales bacterium]|jgi:glycosyltransferase involved in cell wall biosynthesis|nr:glycosyltransferase [Chitinispirillales bacterium]